MLFMGVDRVLGLVDNLDEAKAFFSEVMDVSFDETIVDRNVNLELVQSAFGFELAAPLVDDHPMTAGYPNFAEHRVNIVRSEAIVEEIAELAGALDLKVADELKRYERSLGEALQRGAVSVTAPFSRADVCNSKRHPTPAQNCLLLSFYFASLLFIAFRYFTF